MLEFMLHSHMLSLPQTLIAVVKINPFVNVHKSGKVKSDR